MKTTVVKKEIDRRLHNDGWNNEMASRILGKRRKQTRVYASLASSVTLLVVAVFGLLLYPGSQTKASYKYDSFITKQINGTYNSVFSSKQNTKKISTKNVVIFSNEIDTMIEDTLAQR